MIVFLGDSFTWGQNLHYEKWNEEGSVEYINSKKELHEGCTYEEDLYRKQFHFPNLVAKHFDKSYCFIWGNGGSNYNIIEILENIETQFYSGIKNTIDYFVIQFTCPSRGDINPISFEEQIRKVDSIIKSHGKEWYGISWRPELGEIIEKNYKENFIPIYFKNIKYNNFENILDIPNTNLTLSSKYKTNDSHFSKEGHSLISKSIIEKIENSNIY